MIEFHSYYIHLTPFSRCAQWFDETITWLITGYTLRREFLSSVMFLGTAKMGIFFGMAKEFMKIPPIFTNRGNPTYSFDMET